ncbi:sulfate transporter family-domain-containing protein [Dipodascopsis tothii]|uniref:sulfate transporter family-domain-containing protein n=1 Tax=Dipodascopsis tothii TaxID=44089 RepID=UPI0034CE9123
MVYTRSNVSRAAARTASRTADGPPPLSKLTRISSQLLARKNQVPWRDTAVQSAKYVPSVVLGVMLNVLDGLSYGMILFPLSVPMFADLGADGLSIFYVSCVISQLTISLGGSTFRGGVGSEMIEVVPFFHSMAYTMLDRIGADRPDAVVATTILAYSLSSVVTGAVFLGLGYARIGSLIGFFPRHILIGCIGGVGYFLVVTGLEVSSRMAGSLAYDWATFRFLVLEPGTLVKWAVPLALALVLMTLEHYVKHPLLVPTYFIGVLVGFHVLTQLVPGISLQLLRDAGWVFAGPDAADQPWWHFYTLYKFAAVDWAALLEAVPAMFALTFFGILHVPINVPALAVSTGRDDVDVDRELISHGISNTVSGLCGSIQNYLVYTNSLLFIRSGADSRVAGVMLAAATAGVMCLGPAVIGVVPVMVVGALIFLLGIELLREALYDTYGRVSRVEYVIIVSIIVAMGAWDFVYGIVIGVVMACVSFVIQSARKSAVKATFSGRFARSTVKRHPTQQHYLTQAGDAIYVIKLTGYLFFGTIPSVERRIRAIVADDTVKYLVLDFESVSGMDFSAAEAFIRLKRLLDAREIDFVLTSVLHDDVALRLRSIGVWYDAAAEGEQANDTLLHVFETLNAGLEWSENEVLARHYDRLQRGAPKPGGLLEPPALARADSPLVLWWQIARPYTLKSAEFFAPLCAHFRKETYPAGAYLPPGAVYMLQAGIVVIEHHDFPSAATFTETVVPGSLAGEIAFFSAGEDVPAEAGMEVIVERDATVWALDEPGWKAFVRSEPGDVSREVLRIVLRMAGERMRGLVGRDGLDLF